MKRFIYILLAALFILTAGATKAKVNLSFDHYYDGPALLKAFQELNSNYPSLTKLESIGKSEEGRDIWLFTINNRNTGEDLDKPGIYVDGAIHGNEVQASEVCLYLAYHLLESYHSNPKIKELVDSRAFYIIPVANVDNRWHFFSDPGGYNIGRTGMVPYDDDRDGLSDEDGPEDIDGDSVILSMRIADPYGNYKNHPDDPRVMIPVEKGELGQWRRLGQEGIDNDGDNEINEDGPGYLDMNRNYGFKWQPRYVQSGAGDFPMSGNVTRALSEFIVSKPNICFNFAFHNSGGLWVRGPGSKLAGAYPQSDVAVYDFLGGEGEKITPGYSYIIGGQDMYTTHGDFDEWMFSNLGIFGFVGELFMSRQEQYRNEDEKKDENESWYGGTKSIEKHKFDDNVNQGTMFTDWKKFNHPELGEIEIGGWNQFTTRIPPEFMIQEMVHRNASMVIFTASHAPDVKLELIDVKKLDNGLSRIRVRAYNKNALPTLSAKALKSDMYRKDMFKIKGSGLTVVSGGTIRDLDFDQVSNKKDKPEIIFSSVPSFGTREIQWIVKGSGTATVTFEAIKAANQSLKIDF